MPTDEMRLGAFLYFKGEKRKPRVNCNGTNFNGPIFLPFFSLFFKEKRYFLFFTRADETIQILKAFRDIYFHSI
jgi:hypothetical protein